MKKLLFVMLLSLVVAGCEKEEIPEGNTDTTPQAVVDTGYVKYDGETYPLKKLFYSSGPCYTGGTEFMIYFAPSTISYNSWIDRFTGIGAGLRLDLDVPDTLDHLPVGNFMHQSGEYVEYNLFYSCRLFLSDYDWAMQFGEEYYIPTGNLTISKTGTIYTVNFQGSDESSNAVQLYYKGTAQRCIPISK